MIDQIWTFIQTLCKGTVQGVTQFVSNDLQDYIPLFIFAGVAIVIKLLVGIIKKIKTK